MICFPFNYNGVGKYYLGDAGYGVRKWIISPYHGFCYHLKEFSDNPLRNDKELLNLCHSSLRTSITRHSRVLKKSFCVLDVELFWSLPTHVDVVLACHIIHNHIIGVDHLDSIMSNGLHGSPLAMKVQVEESNNHKGKSKKKIENGFKNRMIYHDMWEDCNAMSDFILFILAGRVMDFFGFIFSRLLCYSYFCLLWTNGFFWFHIFKTSML